jgi:hypothetical protein
MDEKGHFNHIKLTKLASVHPKQNHVTRGMKKRLYHIQFQSYPYAHRIANLTGWMKKGLITFNSKSTHMDTEYQSYRMDEKESHSIKLTLSTNYFQMFSFLIQKAHDPMKHQNPCVFMREHKRGRYTHTHTNTHACIYVSHYDCYSLSFYRVGL